MTPFVPSVAPPHPYGVGGSPVVHQLDSMAPWIDVQASDPETMRLTTRYWPFPRFNLVGLHAELSRSSSEGGSSGLFLRELRIGFLQLSVQVPFKGVCDQRLDAFVGAWDVDTRSLFEFPPMSWVCPPHTVTVEIFWRGGAPHRMDRHMVRLWALGRLE